jgi:hypothetical protein
MTRVPFDQLSKRHQEQVAKAMPVSEAMKEQKKEKPQAFGETFDSKLELRFANEELEPRRLACLLREWRYHPMRFRLADGTWYEPDFLALSRVGSLMTPQDFVFYEVKGSWLSKNARDSRTRLKVAASRYHWFNWYAVTWEKKEGRWLYEAIHVN